MKIAVFSDVHSNLPALEAVLRDIRKAGVARILCLGDTVGYNAEPSACLARVRAACEFVVQGNHDLACADDGSIGDFNEMARAGILYSRKRLSAEEKNYLRGLPLVKESGGFGFVHASLDEPGEFRYVLSVVDALLHFSEQGMNVAFGGHTHKPIVWVMGRKRGLEIMEAKARVSLAEPGRYFVNVGSVGQNREGEPAACYVLFDPEKREIEYRRIAYDVEAAQERIMAAGLPKILAMRLERGR